MCQTVSPQPVIPFRGLSCAASAVVSVVTPHAGRMAGYTLTSPLIHGPLPQQQPALAPTAPSLGGCAGPGSEATHSNPSHGLQHCGTDRRGCDDLLARAAFWNQSMTA